jgi:predicted nucleotidyltransferase
LKVIPSITLMLLKIVAYMDDPQRRAKDLEDIRGLLVEYEADSERVFSDIVLDADLEDYGLAPALLMGLDLRALCNDEEVRIVHSFLEAMTEHSPTWMTFVRARGVGDHVQEDARKQLVTFRRGFDGRV